ncbi:MAG TPA: PIG-L family deacetylase [Thermoanaerobaculia bacterium]|nr:PIG-L family deacetylase [Thermoanaerobaculia bacterium]
MRPRSLALVLGTSLALLGLAAPPQSDESVAAPAYALTPPATGGLDAVDRMLRRLSTHRRLLVVGAHPDDEDTELLALVAQGMGGEAAYLSLSRGEGGQNLVGNDLGVGLGLVRSQELGAARRLDGGRQYFTRAFDFGFTRSIDETLERWPKAVLLEDAVRIVRRFRPQVMVSIFSGTSRDGHGQHQAAGLTAQEAFRVAGDASALPGLAAEGLTPWQPRTLYRETGWFDKESTTIVLPTGSVEPLTGRSYYQIAMASRSLHRSQDMGRLQEIGPQDTAIGWVAGEGRDAKELFAGVDTRLAAMAAEVPDPARRAEIESHLERVTGLASQSLQRLSTPDLGAIVPLLAEALGELRAARALVRPGDGGTGMLIDEKIVLAQGALAASAGVTLDVLAEREVTAPGESVEVTASVWNAGPQSVSVESVALVSPEGWDGGAPASGREVAAGKLEEWKANVAIPTDARPTLPYFLYEPLIGDLYDWSATPAAVRGLPFAPAPLTARVRLTIGGASVDLQRDAAYRLRDEAIGEVRRPVRAAPALDVAIDPRLLVWPIGQRGKRIETTLTSNSGRPLTGRLEVTAPAGWPTFAAQTFSLPKRGDRAFLDVPITPPQSFAPGRYPIAVAAVLADGERMNLGIRTIDYGYIPRTPKPEIAGATISAADIRFPPLTRVGYIRGAADEVPEALLAVGVPIEILSDRDLEAGDLSRFDAILVGSRAYETDPALPDANGRLLDYARAGGLLIVQYQQYGFARGNFAPFPLEIARPHDRVTDETAKVTLLEPQNRVFRTPNVIGPADWDGWVQERGLYFAHTWAPEYTALLAMADPGGPVQKGSLLVARLGKGRYVYTGLAFFRQLPAGVAGAYRLLANLLALK